MHKKQIKKIALFTADPWESAMPVIRVRAPARFAGVEVLQGNRSNSIDHSVLKQSDAIVIQRDFPRFPGCEALLLEARGKKIPVIYECDDMILETPRGHISHPVFIDHLYKIIRAITLSDRVIVSTKPLSDYFKVIHPDTLVFPNYLDDGSWRLGELMTDKAGDQPITIGYMGGASHVSDLEMITPVFLELAREYGQRIAFSFWGVEPPVELKRLPQTRWQAMDVSVYREFASRFGDCQADIWVAPLQDIPFNEYKSAIKFMEYAAVGGAAVFSRVRPYVDVIKDGRNGLLASGQEEWRKALARLIDDREFRMKLAAAARNSLQNSWLLSGHFGEWLDAGSIGLDEIRRQPELKTPAALKMVLRISEQVEEHMEELTAENQHLKALTAKYSRVANSRTWQLVERLRNRIHRG
jgi:glycosyltransferase involved in cell wall biosynthesis